MTRKHAGEKQCKVCSHPGKTEIDAMLLNGAKYPAIIARMKAAHPGEVELTPPNLSRHKTAHLLTKPIKTTEVNPETGEPQEGYIIGHLSGAITFPKEAIPEESVTVPDALKVIFNAGIRNIAMNPELVTPTVLIQAMDLARKLGLNGKEEDEFGKAWGEVARAKTELRRSARRRRRVTVEEEETVEESGQEKPPEDYIEGETVTPDEWSADELKQLGGPNGDE